MFDERAFRSWAHILIGAALFAALFGTAVVLGETLLGPGTSEPLPSRRVLALALLAFVGYVGAARMG